MVVDGVVRGLLACRNLRIIEEKTIMSNKYIGRVLVADGDISTRMLIRMSLEDRGFFVELASNGVEALSKFDSDVFDIVLIDADLPGIGGISVCVNIRRRFSYDVPIVMLTDCGDAEFVGRLIEVGVADYITKPISWTLLGYLMLSILHSRRIMQVPDVAVTKKMAA